jgi:transposase
MYVEINRLHRHGKTYRTVTVRESFRAEGKVMHRTLANLSDLPDHAIQAVQQALRLGHVPTPPSPPQAGCSREYGASMALLSLLRELGLDQMIYSRKEPWRQDLLALIVGRIVFQGSKLALTGVYLDSALWELCGHPAGERPDVEKHAYLPMDRLLERQESIQKQLAKRHLQDGCLVYYDMTSSYAEGDYENSDLVTWGYNRDGKRGHEQMAVGLLTTAQGCPVAVRVFRGNTADQTTVLEQAQIICDEYGVKDVVFVGDRGMLTPKRIEELHALGYKTLTALTHPQMRDLLQRKVVQLELFSEQQCVGVVDPEVPGLQYILHKNPDRAQRDGATRRSLIEKTKEALDKLAKSTRLKEKDKLAAKVGVVLDKHHTGKFVQWSVENGRLVWQLKQELIEQEEAMDGCYIIRNEASALGVAGARDCYKDLIHVEQAFRNLKTVSLEMRPFYHHRDDRLRAHVFLCMLAYYLQWQARARLEPLFAADGEGKNRQWTWTRVIERLKAIRMQTLRIGGTEIPDVISTPDTDQQRILDLLKGKL